MNHSYRIQKRTRKTKDGKVTVYFEARVNLGSRGTRKTFTGAKKRDVEAAVSAFLKEEQARAPLHERSDVTLDAVVEASISRAQVSDVTKRLRRDAWRRRKGGLGKVLLRRFDVARGRQWAAELDATGKNRDCGHAWEALKIVLDEAAMDGVIVANPLILLKKLKPKRKRHAADDGIGRQRIKVYSREEVEALKEASLRSSERLKLLVPLLFDTGLRLGEALGLQWRDVDGNQIHIRRELLEDKGPLELSAEKNAGARRTIYVAPATTKVLGEHEDQMSLVFRSRSGGLQRKRTVYAYWTRMHSAAGIARNGRTPHGARHTHASVLLAEGVPPTDVQRRLGHDSLQTTLQYYSHWMPGEDRARDALNRWLG
ncbi:MAG: site-specific integrase [Myxococcota bacterium]